MNIGVGPKTPGSKANQRQVPASPATGQQLFYLLNDLAASHTRGISEGVLVVSIPSRAELRESLFKPGREEGMGLIGRWGDGEMALLKQKVTGELVAGKVSVVKDG